LRLCSRCRWIDLFSVHLCFILYLSLVNWVDLRSRPSRQRETFTVHVDDASFGCSCYRALSNWSPRDQFTFVCLDKVDVLDRATCLPRQYCSRLLGWCCQWIDHVGFVLYFVGLRKRDRFHCREFGNDISTWAAFTANIVKWATSLPWQCLGLRSAQWIDHDRIFSHFGLRGRDWRLLSKQRKHFA